MSTKSRHPVLCSKKGKTWFENVNEDDNERLSNKSRNLTSWQESNIEKLAEETIYEFVRGFHSIPKQTQYATIEDLDKVKQEVTEVKKRLEALSVGNNSTSEFEPVLKVILLKIAKTVNEAYFKVKGSQLHIYVLIDEYSTEKIEQITQTEIEVSKEYPEIAIEIEPIMHRMEIPTYSQVLLVRA